MNLGKAIKIVLEKKGLSQKELAGLTQISETSISLLLNNQTKPRKETIDVISEVLGVTPEILAMLAIDKDDVPPNKRKIYEAMWPNVENTLYQLFLKK